MAQPGLQRIPLAVDADFRMEPVRANFPDQMSDPWEFSGPPRMPEKAPDAAGDVVADTAYGLAKGAGSLAKYIGWLTNSDTLQQAGQVAEDYWGEKQSAELHRQLDAVGKAEGVMGTVSSLIDNPAAIGDYIATSIPQMVPGLGVGSLGARAIVGFAGNAAKSAALGAGATEAAAMQAGRLAAQAAEKSAMRFAVGANMLGEGAVSGGGTGAEVEKFALERGATPAQAKAAANTSALMAGAWTTAGAGIGAGMETRAMLGRLKDTGIKGLAKNVGKEALEEAIQNPGEDYAGYAGKVQFDPTQTFDPAKSATLGAVTGGIMGGGFHAAGRASERLARRDQTDSAIAAEEIVPQQPVGADGIEGEFIPGERQQLEGMGAGNTYDQSATALPLGQPRLPAPPAIDGDVFGAEALPAGQRLLERPAIEGYATTMGGEFARPPLPAPEQGGPSERQIATSRGLLNHSPKASPDLLARLMRVDQTMAAMLFNHWEAGKNGALATVEQGNAEMVAPGAEGPRDFIPGSASLLESAPVGNVAAVRAGAEVAAPGLRSDMAAGAEGPAGVTAQDIEAHAAATSPFNGTPQPTEAQKAAGNYKVGRLKFQGLDISIENPAGSMRSGTDADGRAWQTEMQHHYGYIKGTVGKDKDHLDVFIKPNAKTAGTAYVVDQADPKTGKFDEHKIIFGADSEQDARTIYQSNYEEGWQGLGAITAMPMADFKAWIKSGKTKKPLAYAEPKSARIATDPVAPKSTGALAIGVTPSSTDPVSIRDGIVYLGEYPAQDFDTGKPVAEMSDGMLGQIAKSSQPAAEKAKAEVSRRAKDKRPQWAKDANVSVGDVFDFSMPSDYATGRMVVEHIDNASASVKDIEPPGNGTVLTGIQLRRAIKDGKAVRVENAAEATAPTAPADRPYTMASHGVVMDNTRAGDITADEFKAAFESLLKNKASIVAELSALTKPAIFKEFPSLELRYKNDKKADVVDAAYRSMLDSFVLGNSISWHMGEKYEDVIRGYVEKTTDEALTRFAADVKDAISERAARSQAADAGMENPVTLDDYKRILTAKAQAIGEGATFQQARMAMPPEQRAKFDELAAEKSRGDRSALEDLRRTEVRAAGQATDGQVIETKHTKTGEPLFVVKAAERVEREVYNEWNTTAKRLGGWYSAYRAAGAVPGFQFKTRANADAFLAFIGGNVEQTQEAVQERRDAFKDDRSQSAVERLTEMAERIEERADESLSVERKANTDRRARMAASAEAAANSDKALAKTMRNIAKAIEGKTAKFLNRVRQKAQVEMLQSLARSAKYQEVAAKNPSDWDRQKLYDQPATTETADYAVFPQYTAYRSDLARLGRQLEEIDGTKKLGAAILKVADDVTDAYLKFAKENLDKVSTFSRGDGKSAVFASRPDAEEAIRRSGFKGKAVVLPFKRGQNIIIMSPTAATEKGVWQGDGDKRITLNAEAGAEIVAKVKAMGKRNRVDMPYVFENVAAERARLTAMGIETPAEFRAALREFIALREAPKAVDKVKELERAMVGRRKDGLDFFPTPAVAADDAIAAADINEGMTVYEPQAGMGHIADRIREAGVEPDVGEIASDRRALLEAKGYNLVSGDFMDMRIEDTPNGEGYDRIIMNPPFSDRRDAVHVQHAHTLLKPGGRLVSIMGEGVFFGQDKKAQEFRDWLDSVGGTSEKLDEGTFMDPSLPVNTGVNARMVVVDKPEGASGGMESRRFRNDGITLTGKELGDDTKPIAEMVREAVRIARERFAGTMARNESDGNAIIIGAQGIKHAMSGQVSEISALAMARLDEVIARAKFVRAEPDKAGRNTIKEVRLYEIPVDLNGNVSTLRVVVRVAADGNRYYDHFEVEKQTPAGQSGKPLSEDSTQPFAGAVPDRSGTATIDQQSDDDNSPPSASSESRAAGQSSSSEEIPSVRAIRDVAEKFKAQFKGAEALNIRVVPTAYDIPERYRKSPFAEGVFHDGSGTIWLVTMNLRGVDGKLDTGRAFQVLLHEAVGHYGLASMMGAKFAGIRDKVLAAAKAKSEVFKETEDRKYKPVDADYATVEAVRQRYPEANDEEIAQEVLARMAETDPGRTLFGYVRAVVRQWFRDMARAFGRNIEVTTAELNDLVALASAYMRRGDNLAGDYQPSGLVAASNSAGLESRRAAATMPAPANDSRRGLLDTLLRKAGGEAAAKITGPAYDRLTAFLGGYIPENIKAGVVSDYGLDEAYTDRRTEMQTSQQKAARKTKTLVDAMELDRAQSRVAYQWLNNRGDEADRLMAQLPPESRQTLEEIKRWIRNLSADAVRLGQLDEEAFARNEFAYLHRSYAKHDLNTNDETWKAERAKAINILGDQYKGRGPRMDIDPDRIHSTPGWWHDEMKGKKVRVLKSEAGRYAFVADGTATPAQYAGYRVEGTWEIRGAKAANKITLWRDFSDTERQMMGELDEAKYAVARTLFMMTRDIEVGRFHEWVADEYAKLPDEVEPSNLADASESMLRAYRPDEWVTVPTTKIPGTGVFKFGALAGMVVPGPVWNDIRQISSGRYEPFGSTYASILRGWKLSKTALTPTTHLNNVMSNFVMADMHDVGARDVLGAVRLMAAAAGGEKDAKALWDRFEDSGATQGMFTTHEIKKEVLDPLLKALREEVGMADDEGAIIKASAVLSLVLHGQFGEAWHGAKAVAKQSAAARAGGGILAKAQDYYQNEDAVFRFAAFLKAIDDGKTDIEAGKLSRKAFLDYSINAPWINTMRGTMMPFIAFSYRAFPMLAETAARKPWKIAKYMLVAGGLNALAYAMLGADADEDRERAFLPDEKSGRLWGVVPKLIRMPWNTHSTKKDGTVTTDPVFLDVRRWIPVGDIVDYGQDKTALPLIPPPLVPGGPAMMVFEFLGNKSVFTGKNITTETDEWIEKAAKVTMHFYKGMAPNVPGLPGTWATDKIMNALNGKTDSLGRSPRPAEAIASGFGIKAETYPTDTLQLNAVLDMKGKLRELDQEARRQRRDFARNGLERVDLDKVMTNIAEKKQAAVAEYLKKEAAASPKKAAGLERVN